MIDAFPAYVLNPTMSILERGGDVARLVAIFAALASVASLSVGLIEGIPPSTNRFLLHH